MAIIIGTRGSKLAIAQTEEVKQKLKQLYPEIQFEIKKIKTTGDFQTGKSYKNTGSERGQNKNSKNIYTKQIDEALITGQIDLAVHSMKDIPTSLPSGINIAAVTDRKDPHDVLITIQGFKLNQLPQGANIATGSLRRKAQVLRVRSNLKVVQIRGNVDIRIKKLYNEKFDAIILAKAGLERLSLEHLNIETLDYNIMLPAAGQGCLGIEIREDDKRMQRITHRLNHLNSRLAVEAERSFLNTLGGGCRVPIGVLGQIDNNKLLLEGIVLSSDGKESVESHVEGRRDKAVEIGHELAQKLLYNGAGKILDKNYSW